MAHAAGSFATSPIRREKPGFRAPTNSLGRTLS
jgi:hypothetical protein